MQAHVYVLGMVTGVFYRIYTKKEADWGALTGWVRNVGDQVEAVFQGPKPQVEKMLQWLHTGSPQAHVESVDVHWEEPTEHYNSFEIRT